MKTIDDIYSIPLKQLRTLEEAFYQSIKNSIIKKGTLLDRIGAIKNFRTENNGLSLKVIATIEKNTRIRYEDELRKLRYIKPNEKLPLF